MTTWKTEPYWEVAAIDHSWLIIDHQSFTNYHFHWTMGHMHHWSLLRINGDCYCPLSFALIHLWFLCCCAQSFNRWSFMVNHWSLLVGTLLIFFMVNHWLFMVDHWSFMVNHWSFLLSPWYLTLNHWSFMVIHRSLLALIIHSQTLFMNGQWLDNWWLIMHC